MSLREELSKRTRDAKQEKERLDSHLIEKEWERLLILMKEAADNCESSINVEVPNNHVTSGVVKTAKSLGLGVSTVARRGPGDTLLRISWEETNSDSA